MKVEKEKKRRPKPMTEARLRNIAVRYLEQYASSSENLRRVLMRRVIKARIADSENLDTAPDAETWIDDIVTRFKRIGVLNDAAFAEAQTQTLHRRGVSAKGVRYRLSAKGVEADDIDAALDTLTETDLTAACNYARRRRLGPWRKTDRQSTRDRDLAALGRQGYSYEVARTVIDSPDIESLETIEDK
jgi:regulatory protein